eukprot:CAMPEP_0194128484 /NCGR_PEP_ID=MMETSP0150-20130528/61083_1 /TAXON_ID=122233 /ORGANISM="Chaetoceros debilis, Strain MM31A-1" /LENGTH=336 /DNA_ID=CAMNT_0038822483 /DNA_START=55 /DNA_END=1062 /DNA_ORIENTATION=+
MIDDEDATVSVASTVVVSDRIKRERRMMQKMKFQSTILEQDESSPSGATKATATATATKGERSSAASREGSVISFSSSSNNLSKSRSGLSLSMNMSAGAGAGAYEDDNHNDKGFIASTSTSTAGVVNNEGLTITNNRPSPFISKKSLHEQQTQTSFRSEDSDAINLTSFRMNDGQQHEKTTMATTHSAENNINKMNGINATMDTIDSTPVALSSPLDRFQVQILENGAECKVTPIEKDVLRATQSPIIKNHSPMIVSQQSQPTKWANGEIKSSSKSNGNTRTGSNNNRSSSNTRIPIHSKYQHQMDSTEQLGHSPMHSPAFQLRSRRRNSDIIVSH